jgi:Smg protein
MFDILMFLLENYMDGSAVIQTDENLLILELEKIGFDRSEINRALQWLSGLHQFQKSVKTAPPLTSLALRHYLPDEAERLGLEGQNLLLFLEKINILDSISREIVIDRVMALDSREIDLGRIKWIILLVLFNQPDKKSSLILMQDMVLADAFDVLH